MDATSFASRRPAATALPTFTLPSPGPGQDSIPRVTNDGLSPSSGVNTGSSQSSQPGYYPHVHSQWHTGGQSAYTYSSAAQNQSQTSMVQPPYSGGRSIFSPYGAHRSSHSPATGDGLPQPASYQSHDVHSYSGAMAGGGGAQPSLPSQSGPASHSQLQNPILSSHAPVTQPPTPASSTSATGDYRQQQPPTPYSPYPPSTTPSQPSFPSFQPHPSPTQPSPTTSAATPRGLSSLSGMAPPMAYGASRPPQGYPYQMSGGPVMSNIGNPGGQMHLVSGMPGMSMPAGYGHGGHHPVHMYGHSQQTTQERPFKCDECPQSFNRNHDLKRHKRIHLAVKPFPCTFCDKSFSRKDALKRHRLVKGCGEKAAAAGNDGSNTNAGGDGTSPPDRSDLMSDTANDSTGAAVKHGV